ncbi:hypothetical protein HID58_023929 [Brassica napus]|uniref:Uncharacterized protein n=1 Tax=Brassica napus TaxID=3708 RepID=A0ABQ8D3F9_BRANA|nr:hypothetical protein HID58_023929 [Brassica napus]
MGGEWWWSDKLDLIPCSNASPGFKANGTSERQRCCCLHSSTTSSCAKNNGYSCFRSVPDALAVNSDGRYLTTRGVDRHVHKVQFVSAFMIMKVDKAEKLDGG